MPVLDAIILGDLFSARYLDLETSFHLRLISNQFNLLGTKYYKSLSALDFDLLPNAPDHDRLFNFVTEKWELQKFAPPGRHQCFYEANTGQVSIWTSNPTDQPAARGFQEAHNWFSQLLCQRSQRFGAQTTAPFAVCFRWQDGAGRRHWIIVSWVHRRPKASRIRTELFSRRFLSHSFATLIWKQSSFF